MLYGIVEHFSVREKKVSFELECENLWLLPNYIKCVYIYRMIEVFSKLMDGA